MKAINVKILNRDVEKICATAEQAISFLEKHITVNETSASHIKRIFRNIYQGIVNENGGVDGSFSAGNNSKNPTVWVRDITGASSIAEMSPTNLKGLANSMILKFKKQEPDFKLTYNGSYIEGGFLWYWVQSQQRHFAVYELWFKPSEFNSLNELQTYIEQRSQDSINLYLQNSKKA